MMRCRSTPAAATAACVRGITSYSFGHPPMSEDMTVASHFAPKTEAAASPVRVSKLPNGVRVVSQHMSGPQVTVGAYIEAGAKYDPAQAPGLSYVMRWAISGSNMDNSLFQLDRNARVVGAAREHCEIRKRFVGLKFEAPQGDHWKMLTHDLLTSVAAPRFPEYDVERFRDTMDNLLQEMRWNEPREYCIDQLETAAYYREPLGNPRMVSPELNASASHGALLQQWARLAQPSRTVVVGLNVDHDELIATYENAPFPHSASAPHHAKSLGELPTTLEKSQFIPGGERVELENRSKAMGTKPDQEAEGIFALGFGTHGAEGNLKGYAASLVTRELAAGAFAESLNVNGDRTRNGIESFYRPYSEAGLIGATMRGAPSDMVPMLTETAKVLRALPKDAEALQGAKARAITRFYSEHLEVQRDYADFLASNLIGDTMNRHAPSVFFDAINDVNAAAVTDATSSFAGRPAMFGTGDVAGVPSLRQLGL